MAEGQGRDWRWILGGGVLLAGLLFARGFTGEVPSPTRLLSLWYPWREIEAKADALLIAVYRAGTATPRDDAALEALARQVDLEISPGEVRVGILARTSLDDATLQGAGVTVTARIGEIVSGSLLLAQLPALAAFDDVRSIEAAQLLRPN